MLSKARRGGIIWAMRAEERGHDHALFVFLMSGGVRGDMLHYVVD